jgi:hypothetical protein
MTISMSYAGPLLAGAAEVVVPAAGVATVWPFGAAIVSGCAVVVGAWPPVVREDADDGTGCDAAAWEGVACGEAAWAEGLGGDGVARVPAARVAAACANVGSGAISATAMMRTGASRWSSALRGVMREVYPMCLAAAVAT